MLNTTSQKKLNKQDLINYFLNGSKNTERTGLEYEKLGVCDNNFQAVTYNKMEHFLEKLSEFENYERVFNNQNNEHIIGLKNNFAGISLEPGSQFEISLSPQKELCKLEEQIIKHNELTGEIAKDLGIVWVGCGLQPISVYNNIKIIPKKRYEYMSEYLPKVAQLPLVMMRETAGIQTAIDYQNEQDAIEKLRLCVKLSPIVSAAFSNSPIRNGKLTGYKSFRAKSWTDTDEQRCGLVSPKLFDSNCHFSFEDYVDILCNLQMIMIGADKEQKCISNFSFNDFLQNGYNGKYPTIQDFKQHASLYFADTRIKKYLEIRNHDSQRQDFIMCVPALWKGIMYNNEAREEICKILKSFTYEDFEKVRHEAPKNGLNCKIAEQNLHELTKEIFEIAYCSLKETNEEKYLEPILELVTDGITPADIIIRNFEGIWNKDLQRYINFCRI